MPDFGGAIDGFQPEMPDLGRFYASQDARGMARDECLSAAARVKSSICRTIRER